MLQWISSSEGCQCQKLVPVIWQQMQDENVLLSKKRMEGLACIEQTNDCNHDTW